MSSFLTPEQMAMLARSPHISEDTRNQLIAKSTVPTSGQPLYTPSRRGEPIGQSVHPNVFGPPAQAQAPVMARPAQRQGTPPKQQQRQQQQVASNAIRQARERDALMREIRDATIVLRTDKPLPSSRPDDQIVKHHYAPQQVRDAIGTYVPAGYTAYGWDPEKLSPKAKALVSKWGIDAQDKAKKVAMEQLIAQRGGKPGV